MKPDKAKPTVAEVKPPNIDATGERDPHPNTALVAICALLADRNKSLGAAGNEWDDYILEIEEFLYHLERRKTEWSSVEARANRMARKFLGRSRPGEQKVFDIAAARPVFDELFISKSFSHHKEGNSQVLDYVNQKLKGHSGKGVTIKNVKALFEWIELFHFDLRRTELIYFRNDREGRQINGIWYFPKELIEHVIDWRKHLDKSDLGLTKIRKMYREKKQMAKDAQSFAPTIADPIPPIFEEMLMVVDEAKDIQEGNVPKGDKVLIRHRKSRPEIKS